MPERSIFPAAAISLDGSEKTAHLDAAARYFNTTPQFWMNLQANFDLASVPRDEIDAIEPRAA